MCYGRILVSIYIFFLFFGSPPPLFEQIMIEFGLNSTPAYSRCLSDEPPLLWAPPPPTNGGASAPSGSFKGLYVVFIVEKLLGRSHFYFFGCPCYLLKRMELCSIYENAYAKQLYAYVR